MHEILKYFTLTEIQVERQHFRSGARDTRAWRPTEIQLTHQDCLSAVIEARALIISPSPLRQQPAIHAEALSCDEAGCDASKHRRSWFDWRRRRRRVRRQTASRQGRKKNLPRALSARKTTAAATSCGSPQRPMGERSVLSSSAVMKF